MPRILGISGSLRSGSVNTALLRAAQSLSVGNVEMEVATLHGIPLYDGDVEEKQGIPEAVEALKQQIADSHGLILSTPEYNNGIPGVFKNAIDWLSRPPADIARLFRDRPVTVIGATPGGMGTILAQTAWLPILRTLGTRYWTGGRLLVSGSGKLFDENGELQDEATREKLREFLQGFSEYIQTRH